MQSAGRASSPRRFLPESYRLELHQPAVSWSWQLHLPLERRFFQSDQTMRTPKRYGYFGQLGGRRTTAGSGMQQGLSAAVGCQRDETAPQIVRS
jgi:hypothetical protein